MMVNHSRICTSTGMLRRVSMKTEAARLASQLLDSRARPTTRPSRVDITMPATARRSVVTMPDHSARPAVSGFVSMPSLSWMLAGPSIQS